MNKKILLSFTSLILGAISGVFLSVYLNQVDKVKSKQILSERFQSMYDDAISVSKIYLKMPYFTNYDNAQKLYLIQNYSFRSETCIYSLIAANKFNCPEGYYKFAQYYHDMTIQLDCASHKTSAIEKCYLRKCLQTKDSLYSSLSKKAIENDWK